MNLIYYGNYKNIKALIANPISVPSDIDPEEFKEFLWDYRRRTGLTMVFYLPLNLQRQNQILKFSEEFRGDVVLYSPFFRGDIIDTIMTRFVMKIDEKIPIRPDRLFEKWRSEHHLENFNPLTIKHFLKHSDRSRSGKLLIQTLSKFLKPRVK